MVNPLVKFMARAMLARSDEALLKASGGAPRVVRGRTLDPKFQFLEAQARKAPRAIPTPDKVRAQTRDLVAMFGGRAEPGVRWEPLEIPADGRKIQARLYRPREISPKAAAITYFHFGGGVIGDLDTPHAFCTMLANEAKAPLVSIDYRLAPEHVWPAGLEDCIAGYLWTVANAGALGAQADRAAIGGDSMGGNFSAIIAQEARRRGAPAPVLQVLIYPATDIASDTPSMHDFGDAFPLTADTMAWFMANYLPPGTDGKDTRISPAYGELAGLPPALIYTAGFDPLCDQGEIYAQKLRAAGVSAAYHCFESLAHGFTAFTGAIPAADAACRRMARETAAALANV